MNLFSWIFLGAFVPVAGYLPVRWLRYEARRLAELLSSASREAAAVGGSP
jgi:hypothetical protein